MRVRKPPSAGRAPVVGHLLQVVADDTELELVVEGWEAPQSTWKSIPFWHCVEVFLKLWVPRPRNSLPDLGPDVTAAEIDGTVGIRYWRGGWDRSPRRNGAVPFAFMRACWHYIWCSS
jgi:hypothetical protein